MTRLTPKAKGSLLSYLTILLLTTLTTAAKLTVLIPSSSILPNPIGLPPTTHATLSTLSHGSTKSPLRASITRDSRFIFDLGASASAASYLLDVHARDVVFAAYRVDVGAGGVIEGVWETFRGNEWDNKGAPVAVFDEGEAKDAEVKVKALTRREFYETRAGFSPLSLLKNPMILLGVVALGITFGMPYLIDNMDPESRAEFEEQSRKSPLVGLTSGAMPGGGGAGAPSFDLAGWMAGATTSPVAASGRDTGSQEGARKRG